MIFSTTDGKIYDIAEMCCFCQIDTGGNHRHNCPLVEKNIEQGFWLNNHLFVTMKEKAIKC